MTNPNKPASQQGTSGDQIGRDRISTGDIDGSVVAIGAGAQVIYKNVERALTEVEVLEKEEVFERKRLAEGVTAYVQRLQKKAEGAKVQPIFISPYKELIEYDIRDTALFYGRSKAITGLLNQIGRGPLTVLHADSGVGKTSLLKAGIVPRLLGYGNLPLYLRPHRTPVHLAVKQGLLMQLDQTPHLRDSSLHEFLQRVTDLLGDQGLVVIVDQFEELFTEQDAEMRTGFVTELAPCLDDDLLPVRWIFALRDEWFGQLGTFRPHIRQPFANEFLLRALTRDEAIEVIVEPAKHHGIEYESGLVQNLIRDLGEAEVAPPQVQLVCSTLFEALNGQTTITKKMYEDVGGTAGILRGHLERVLSREVPPKQRRSARLLLEALITSDKRRALRTEDSLRDEVRVLGINRVALDEILRILVDSRLLRVEEIGEEKTELAYELAHDYLLDEIELDPAVQARKAAQELLEQKVPYFTREDLLLSRDELDIINPHRDRLTISEAAANLLRRSQAVVMRRRRLSITGIAIAIMLILVAIITFTNFQRNAALDRETAALELAYSQGTAAAEQAMIASTAVAAQAEAVTARLLAEEEAAKARSRQLAAQSSTHAQNQLDLALLLAMEAYRTDPTFEARASIMSGLSRNVFPIEIWRGHTDRILHLTFSPDGTSLVSTGYDKKIILWDVSTGKPLGRFLTGDQLAGVPLSGHWFPIGALAFSFDGSILASSDGSSVIYWDVATGEVIGEIGGGSFAEPWTIAFSPDLTTLTSSNFGLVSVWDILSEETLQASNETASTNVMSAAFSPDGNTFATADLYGSVILWDTVTVDPIAIPVTGDDTSSSSVTFHPSGGILVAATGGDMITFYDVSSGESLGDLSTGNVGSVSALAITTDGEHLASGDSNGNIVISNLVDGESLPISLKVTSESIESVSFSPNGNLLAAGVSDGTIYVWDLSSPPVPAVPLLADEYISPVVLSYSPEGTFFATGDSDGEILLWDSTSLKTIGLPLTGHTDWVESLAISPDGEMLASGSWDGEVILWDVVSGKQLGESLTGHGDRVESISFSPDGSRIITASTDGIVLIHDVITRELIRTMEGKLAILSPDGQTLAIIIDYDVSFDNVVLVDVNSGEPFGQIIDLGASINSIAFNPDGQTLATGDSGGQVILWSATTGEMVAELPVEHTGFVEKLAFSPDGTILASNSMDGTIMLWDVATQSKLSQPIDISSYGFFLAFSPDGESLISDGSGEPFLLKLDLDLMQAKACHIANRNLSQSEWDRFMTNDIPYRFTCPEVVFEEHILQDMLLSPAELGEIAVGMDSESLETGYIYNERVARESIDSEASAEELAELGRIVGYRSVYQHPNYYEGFEDNYKGILRVETEIELFKESEDVNRSMNRSFDILKQFEGEEIEGLSIISWDQFPLNDLADVSWGITIQFGILPNEILATRTHAIFRHGSLAAGVSILRTDEVDDRAEAERLARIMENKIRQTLLGETDPMFEVIRPLNQSAALP